MKPVKPVRCAIYTRVSTDQGLEQDFNSLDAQYDASQAYIRSQAHAGWTLLRAKYDDGGFSGGNTDRPALQRLLNDVQAGKVLKAVRGAPRSASPLHRCVCKSKVGCHAELASSVCAMHRSNGLDSTRCSACLSNSDCWS
jgi:resolvase-like protein